MLLSSLLFFTWGAGNKIWVLLLVIAVTFFGAKLVVSIDANTIKRKLVFSFTILFALVPLLWFKYAAFGTEITAALFG